MLLPTPASLSACVGNSQILSILKNYLKADDHTNSFIFRGPVNTGKTLVANLFLRELQGLKEEAQLKLHTAMEMSNVHEVVFDALDSMNLVLLDDFDFLTEDAKRLFLKKTVSATNIVVCTNTLEPDYLPSHFLILDFSYLDAQELFDHAHDVCNRADVQIAEEQLTGIVRASKGDIRKCFNALEQLSSGSASFDELTKGRHFRLLKSIFSTLQDGNRLAEHVDTLTSHLSVQLSYVALAEYAMDAYLYADFCKETRNKHGKKLVAYAKELYTLSKKSLTKSALVCDLILLDDTINGNKIYKGTVDTPLLDSSTTSRVKMQRSLIKSMSSKSAAKEYSASDLAYRLGGSCRSQTG